MVENYDVIVVGGGPSGSATAVFTARYGLDTLILDRGSSSIRQCAFIENYPGFPGGIDVETFYAMLHAHVERVGGTIESEMATTVEIGGDGLIVETDAAKYRADRVVAASTYDVSYLEPILGEYFESDGGESWIDSRASGERGETPVDGLWLAGPTAGLESQITVSTGHGARVGLDIVTDYRREEEGLWEAAADYTDWVVQQGRYEGEEWLEHVADYYAERAPDDLDEEYIERMARERAEAQQDWQIDEETVAERTERAHRRLLDHVDDDLIRERAAELAADGGDS